MIAGLSSAEAAARLAAEGQNVLPSGKPSQGWRALLDQFKSPVVVLLLLAAAISGVLGEALDAAAIAAIVVVNACVGFFQEFRAEKAVFALRALAAPRATVRRDGRPRIVPAAEIVRGDVLVLEAGDVVAADAEVLESHALRTAEAALTGESVPVDKAVGLTPGAPLAARTGELFLGTSVVHGTGLARVSAVGAATELGRIAGLLATAQDGETPLEQRLAKVTKTLVGICLGLVAAVAAIGLARGEPVLSVFVSAVALAVAAVPEGLPAIVTIALSIGVQRMAKRNALVRHLPAVETLGCTTVICTDKTGTLTSGVMAVRELWSDDPKRLLEAAAACCDAELGPPAVGDPTELALLTAAAAQGIDRAQIERDLPRLEVVPFDSARKRMAVLRDGGQLFVKGAFEAVAPLCRGDTTAAAEATAGFAGRGLRVLAVAVGRGAEERDLTLLGLAGLADPPRPEAIEAVRLARAAGIVPVMITGDHPVTAAAIAREMGLVGPGDPIAERVHARATPEQKLEIVRGWKQRGAIVAMTGDGVNDAPALREAHIGIAMGKTGTEVTREAADVVLLDDDFASIVAAVREGRGIFDNLRKSIVYLLAGNCAELGVMLAASVMGVPLPFLPLHLLWINLVTDGLPALALVADPPSPDAMKRPPRPPTEPMLGRWQWASVGLAGFLEGTTTLAVYLWALPRLGLDAARGMAFTALVFGQLFRAFNARSTTRIFWETGVFTNRALVGVVVGSVAVQVLLHHVPFTQRLFALHAPTAFELGVCLAAGLLPTTLLELAKPVRRWVAQATASKRAEK